MYPVLQYVRKLIQGEDVRVLRVGRVGFKVGLLILLRFGGK